MTITVVNTTTKPEGTFWYINDIDPAHVQIANDHKQWVNNFPGLISKTPDQTESPNVKKQTLVFETEEAYNRFLDERNNKEFWVTRKAYNDTNGIITETEIIVN